LPFPSPPSHLATGHHGRSTKLAAPPIGVPSSPSKSTRTCTPSSWPASSTKAC
jgi:hypothetical protein